MALSCGRRRQPQSASAALVQHQSPLTQDPSYRSNGGYWGESGRCVLAIDGITNDLLD